MTGIKICGIKDENTLEIVATAGANFFGMVMALNSPRYISKDRAKQLVDFIKTSPELKNKFTLQSVLLLTNPNLTDVIDLCQHIKPDIIQLHGNESGDFCKNIKVHIKLPLIKAFAISEIGDFDKLSDYNHIVDYFLFDAKAEKTDNRTGGLGRTFDWSILQHYNLQKPYFLAGGLNINNITNALATTHAPYVDVSSGVEISKGIYEKSPEKIIAFCDKIRKIDVINH